MTELPDSYYNIGGKLYQWRYNCGKMVRIKRFLGGLHICVEQERLKTQDSLNEVNYDTR